MALGVEPLVAGTVEAGRRRRTWAAFALAAVALVLGAVVLSRVVSQPEGTVHRYEIPPGTAAALAAGEPVDVLPADLELRLRDTLVVVNLDDQAHQVGPFRVAPGEQLSRPADQLSSFSGFCSLHPDRGLDIAISS